MLDVRRRLKRRGVTGIGIPDLMIAMTAQAHHKVILTSDRGFWRMQPVLGLQLLEVSG